MLRTRLYLGLLPFLLLMVVTGSYAVWVSRQFAGSIQRDLVADYGAVLASQRMREAATLMSAASARAHRGDPFGARRAYDQQRSAFIRELMAQSAAGARLEVQCESELGRLSVDFVRIRHVFINLLSNAVKFSPPGGVVTLAATSAPPGFVRFSVRDTGPGIPADSLARVFDRFYRAPGQTKSGAGLGLAIAREIVVAHGGSIACTSEPGQGSEFHFLLPG
ncbi:MAG: ATP-binding protein [Undibacterium sp.]|nr:ATP-binding protein [Opitutaceae bacterium]